MTFFFRARGRVQGVGYRAFVRRQARAQAIVGWVRNEADGSVAGQASGTASALALFRGILRAGPLGLCGVTGLGPLNEENPFPLLSRFDHEPGFQIIRARRAGLPKPGVLFRDIASVGRSGGFWRAIKPWRHRSRPEATHVLGLESGFHLRRGAG